MPTAPLIPRVRIGRLDDVGLDRLHADATSSSVTYDHVGSTLHVDRRSDNRRASSRTRVHRLGVGRDAFDAGRQAIEAWAGHRELGVRIHPPGASVALDATVLVVLTLGPVKVVAPTRIVEVVDEPNRFGFAYGTLPGHPERGEECFLVEQRGDGSVVASITVDAVPGTFVTRLFGRIVRIVQDHAIRTYLRGIARA